MSARWQVLATGRMGHSRDLGSLVTTAVVRGLRSPQLLPAPRVSSLAPHDPGHQGAAPGPPARRACPRASVRPHFALETELAPDPTSLADIPKLHHTQATGVGRADSQAEDKQRSFLLFLPAGFHWGHSRRLCHPAASSPQVGSLRQPWTRQEQGPPPAALWPSEGRCQMGGVLGSSEEEGKGSGAGSTGEEQQARGGPVVSLGQGRAGSASSRGRGHTAGKGLTSELRRFQTMHLRSRPRGRPSLGKLSP